VVCAAEKFAASWTARLSACFPRRCVDEPACAPFHPTVAGELGPLEGAISKQISIAMYGTPKPVNEAGRLRQPQLLSRCHF